MKVKYKIIELIHFGTKLGIFTVRKEEKVGRIEVSSKVFESTDRKICLAYVRKMKNQD